MALRSLTNSSHAHRHDVLTLQQRPLSRGSPSHLGTSTLRRQRLKSKLCPSRSWPVGCTYLCRQLLCRCRCCRGPGIQLRREHTELLVTVVLGDAGFIAWNVGYGLPSSVCLCFCSGYGRGDSHSNATPRESLRADQHQICGSNLNVLTVCHPSPPADSFPMSLPSCLGHPGVLPGTQKVSSTSWLFTQSD